MSSSFHAVVVAAGEPPLVAVLFEQTVGVAVTMTALKLASLLSATLARCASTPVPAAKPTTAAARSPMIQLSKNTSVLTPHITPFVDFLPSGSACAGVPGWEYVPVGVTFSVNGL
jgi:hypothetical protein